MPGPNVVDIKKIYEDMQRAVENEIPRMTEGAFTTLFLPMFLDQNKNEHGLVMANWIEFSGSPFKSVHVVDNNDSSKILFTVPPISDRNALNDLGKKDANGNPLPTVEHVIDTYSRMARVGPGVGENYISQELNKRFELMKGTPDFQKNMQVWRDIFARYGKGEVLDTKMTVTEKKERDGNEGDAIEDF